MDRHGGHPGLLHGFGKLHAVDGALVPAQAELHRHRPTARAPDHRFRHFDRQLRVLHQPRAVPGIGHLGYRAAHIDVNDIGAGALPGHARRLLHTGRVAAEDLHRRRVFPLPQLKERNGLFVLIAQGLGAHHLRDGIARPQLPADGPEGQVCHSRHRSQRQSRIYRDIANFHSVPQCVITSSVTSVSYHRTGNPARLFPRRVSSA